MKNKFSLSVISQRPLMAAVFLCTALFSCKKDQGNLGLLIQPEEDILNGIYVDTFSLVTYSLEEDSLRTDELSKSLLGSYVDPVFGKTTAGFYTQLRLSANAPTFDVPNIIVDSVVLQLVYDGYYGKLDPQTFRIFEVMDTLYKDSSYYSNSGPTVDITDLVEPSSALQTPDPVNYYYHPFTGDSAKPQLRLRISNSIGQRFINESGSANLADNAAFTNWFKGLFITVDNPSQVTGQGALLYFDAEHADSRLTVYYRDTNLGDTLEFALLINENCARFTNFQHDYTGTEVGLQLADTTLGQRYFYLQAGAGLNANIKFPTLHKLVENGPVVINKAELILPVQYYTIDPLAPPAAIFSFALDSTNKTYSLKDNTTFIYTGESFSSSGKEYKVLMTRQIQDYLTGNVLNNGVRILAGLGAVSGNRVVFSGPDSPTRAKPYLKITYTKY